MDVHPEPGSFDAEAALARLDDVVLGLPTDALLPDVDDLLARAKVPSELHDDPRVLALLEDAVRARPWGRPERRDQVAQQVSLLELEVDVWRGRLATTDDPEELAAAEVSLRRVRAQLESLLAELG